MRPEAGRCASCCWWHQSPVEGDAAADYGECDQFLLVDGALVVVGQPVPVAWISVDRVGTDTLLVEDPEVLDAGLVTHQGVGCVLWEARADG